MESGTAENKQLGTVLVVAEKSADGKSMSVTISQKATVEELKMILDSINEHIGTDAKASIQ